MTYMKNITDDILGWKGHIIDPGALLSVSDEEAQLMIDSNPAKFERLEPVGGGANNRAVDTRQPHRHYYRRDGTCRCGRREAGS